MVKSLVLIRRVRTHSLGKASFNKLSKRQTKFRLAFITTEDAQSNDCIFTGCLFCWQSLQFVSNNHPYMSHSMTSAVNTALLNHNYFSVSYFYLFLLPFPLHLQGWRWRQYVSPKRWYLPTSPHGVTIQIIIFICLITNPALHYVYWKYS
jgi:hypothetical protein